MVTKPHTEKSATIMSIFSLAGVRHHVAAQKPDSTAHRATGVPTEWGTGNREQAMGNGEQGGRARNPVRRSLFRVCYSRRLLPWSLVLFPDSSSLFPVPCSLLLVPQRHQGIELGGPSRREV